MASRPSRAHRVTRPSSLADVLDVVLDKGLVIDAYVRTGLLGIQLTTFDARVVAASVDTYLQYAEAVNRLDLQPEQKPKGLPELLEEGIEGTAETVGEGTLDRPAQLVEKATDPVGQLVEEVTGGGTRTRTGTRTGACPNPAGRRREADRAARSQPAPFRRPRRPRSSRRRGVGCVRALRNMVGVGLGRGAGRRLPPSTSR